jgi:hypothetical protein
MSSDGRNTNLFQKTEWKNVAKSQSYAPGFSATILNIRRHLEFDKKKLFQYVQS